jgi:hypothetical protein
MPGFTDRFGGSAVNPSDVGYLALAFSVNTTLTWPSSGGLNVVARLIDTTPAGPGLTLTLPDARESSKGYDTLINNLGADTFTVLDASGGTIGTVAAGGVRYFYLTNISTLAGVWRSLNIGSLTSSVDAATLVGLGLRASATTLQTNLVTSTFSAGFTIAASDRARVLVWTGGVGTLALPLLSTLDLGFHFEVRNQGTGVLTIAPSGGELIDASASLTLQTTESMFVHVGPTAWYSVGRGRNTQFSFTQLTKTITGGTTVLTPTEAANVVQKYVGVLVSNAIVEFPAYIQVYYVSNQTTGAFSVTFKNAGAGTTVVVPQGQNAVLFSDGTNVINSSTTISGISSLSLNVGSAGAPSLNYVGDGTTGFFQPTSGTIGFSVTGVEVARFTSTGLRLNTLGAVSTPAFSFVADPNTGIYSPAADQIAIATAGAQRWLVNATGNHTFLAPSAGNTLTLGGFVGASINFIEAGTANAGFINGMAIRNTDNTNAASHASLLIFSGGASGGDAFSRYDISGVTSWSAGIDNSSADSYKISSSATLGTNDRFSITTAGNVTFFAPTSGNSVTIGGFVGALVNLIEASSVNTGFANRIAIRNTDNTSGASHSSFLTLAGGASGGDASSIYEISGVISWSAGIDNSDGDAYVISANATLGTTNRLRLDATTGVATFFGAVVIPAPAAGVSLTVTGLATASTDSITATSAASGFTHGISVINSSNTADSSARIYAEVAGGSAGDPFFEVQIAGGQQYVFGLDNSDSDAFKISNSNALGTNDLFRLTTSGNLTVVAGTGTLGYGTGAGGTVTQVTNKATGVTLNKASGQIVTNNASLAGNTAVSFTFTNSTIAATDTITFSIAAAMLTYVIQGHSMAAGSCQVTIFNINAGTFSDAIPINFNVIKGVTS